MAEKAIKTRVQMKRDSSENWSRATGFKPLEGEQIFYTDLNKIKVGKYQDGTTEEQKKSVNHTDYLMLLSELDFINADYVDTGATSVEVTGTGNVITTASYDASTRKLTLTKDATSVTTDNINTEVTSQINTLISSGFTDPSTSTDSQYYFKYN